VTLRVPPIALALALGLLLVAIVSLGTAHRGGRFRGLPGWQGSGVLRPLLVLLSRADRRVSLSVLGVLMFAALREYFFVAPLRPRDRWAILAAYLSIPIALWPEFVGSWMLFLTVAPLALFVFLPVLLALGTHQPGCWNRPVGC